MKCTPMRLLHRSELDKRKTERGFQIIREPKFTSEENSWYEVTRSSPSPAPNSPKLSVKNLEFPDDSASYNSGNSLEKWSKKRPKLRSNRSARPKPAASDDIEDVDACDISNIISSLDAEAEEVVEEEEYEVSSDIEQLLRESQEFEEQEKQARRKSGNGKKKPRKKLKKTITFSFSKPASPETKKVIRVDVTSSVSLDELRYLQTQKEIDDELSNRFEGVLSNNDTSNDCVVKCSQLVLTPKR